MRAANEPKYSHLAKLHTVIADHAAVLFGDAPTRETQGSLDVTRFSNTTAGLVFLGNTGSAIAVWSNTGKVYTVAGGSHVLLSRSGEVLFNSSAVGSNADPRFTTTTATTAPLKWSMWHEGPPSRHPAPPSSAPRPPVIWADSPIEQVELELNTVGGRVTDYVWYSVNFSTNADAAEDRNSPGAIAVFPCTDDSAQRWSLVAVGASPSAAAAGTVQIRAAGDTADSSPRCIGINQHDGYDGGFGAALHRCDPAAHEQRFTIGVDGRVHGANGLCLDIQDGSSAIGANVFVYACGPRPAGNQEWSVVPVGVVLGSVIHIVSKMDGYCLQAAPVPSPFNLVAELYESTIAHAYLDGAFVGTLDNQGHNGQKTSVSLQLPANLSQHNHVLELLSAGLGISADEASARIAEGGVTGTLGLATLVVSNASFGSSTRWRMQTGLLGEAISVPTGVNATGKAVWSVVTAPAVGALTWLQAEFDAPADWRSPEALAADLTGCGKGHLFINGFDAGRFWIRDPQLSTVYQLPPDHIKPTGNRLVLWEEMGAANISAVRVVRRVG